MQMSPQNNPTTNLVLQFSCECTTHEHTYASMADMQSHQVLGALKGYNDLIGVRQVPGEATCIRGVPVHQSLKDKVRHSANPARE